ncbi:alpha/beta fold hydrolase [Marinicella meishanensis]|uniref:alpha/beta fold hydrolase n=1 Tax=Marinicella meishanensis TaxID=2873263 RepID=UPI001CBB2972|nr:alpha/beta fold hydrolase [Marinicella sp. NBU2979]
MNTTVTTHRLVIDAATLPGGDGKADLEVECCLWGPSNRPVVVLMGGISASRWAFDSVHGPGWWQDVMHDAGALSVLDHSFLTFEYVCWPDQPGAETPLITTADQARVLRKIQQQLDLPQFHAVIGASYGGMVSLAFAALFPQALARLVCIAAAHKNSVKTKAWRLIQRQIMQLGQRHAESPAAQAEFTALARALAMVGYRGELEWQERFASESAGRDVQAMASYLDHHGQRFAARFCARRYAQLSQSIDYHQVDVASIQADTLLIGFTSDQMVPTDQLQQLHQALRSRSRLHLINSIYGHDGFLLEAEALNCIFNTFFEEHNHDHIERNHRRASGY